MSLRCYPIGPMHYQRERKCFIDTLLVRINYILVMSRWTGLAPWEFEFPFPGDLASTFDARPVHLIKAGDEVDWPRAMEVCQLPFLGSVTSTFLSPGVTSYHTQT